MFIDHMIIYEGPSSLVSFPSHESWISKSNSQLIDRRWTVVLATGPGGGRRRTAFKKIDSKKISVRIFLSRILLLGHNSSILPKRINTAVWSVPVEIIYCKKFVEWFGARGMAEEAVGVSETKRNVKINQQFYKSTVNFVTTKEMS